MTEEYNPNDSLYFVYTKEKNELKGFVGPLFLEEVDECVKSLFQGEKAEVADEKIFKSLYTEEYIVDFRNNWVDYLSYFLDLNSFDHDIIDVDLSNELEIDNNIIYVSNVAILGISEECLWITPIINSKPSDIAYLTLVLMKYCDSMIEIIIGEDVFLNNDGNIFTGEDSEIEFNKSKILNISSN